MTEPTGWIVAIDTATGVNVGLAKDGEPVAARSVADTRSHAELTQTLVDEVLAEQGLGPAELAGVVVGVGPGPFTGLRVGIVTGTVLASLVGIPVKGVCTLDAIAQTWLASHAIDTEFVVATDARRKELYWARYGADGSRIGEPQVSAPDALPDLPVLGAGVAAYPELLGPRAAQDADVALDAAGLAAHSERCVDAGLEPIYLRKPDAELPSTRKSALTSRRIRLGKK